MAGALLLQIGVNLANDYYDFMKGVDTGERLGPVRVTQSGLIPPERVKHAIIAVMVLIAAVGSYLIVEGGWPILVAGVASLLAMLAYSGGPYPLASHGLGDLFVFLFFGLVAVCGTYYVQTHHLTPLVVWAAVPMGFLITAILVVNNLRDIPTDQRASKRTLAVMLGETGSRVEYLGLLAGAYVVPFLLWAGSVTSAWPLLSLLSLPMAILLLRILRSGDAPSMNRALAGTARLAFVYSLLLSAGLLL